MIVVDINILAYLYLPGDFTHRAEALLSGREYEMDSYDVLARVPKSDCSAYDCEFVALAVRLGIRLVTMDKKLLRGFPGEAVPLDAAGV